MQRKLKKRFRKLCPLAIIVLIYYIFSKDHYAEDAVRNLIIYVKQANIVSYKPTDTSAFNCANIINGSKSDIVKARMWTWKSNQIMTKGRGVRESCVEFKKSRGYIEDVSDEERDFPVAFSILTYKKINQLERLLRSVYRPSNFYCIHVDRKSVQFLDEVRHLVSCFPNVFLSSRNIEVVWGGFSVLESELICMEDLLNISKYWKYFINLTGEEYPLKTNYQLVKILKAYRGANDVERANGRYWEKFRRFFRAGRPPHDLDPVIGSVHITVNRKFVEFAVNDPVAKDLLEWLKNTEIPDETFFPTLNYNPQLGIPGTFNGSGSSAPFLTRYKNWDHGLLIYKDDCEGMYQREICILGVGDLNRLVKRKHLFANKFKDDFQPAALDCIEQWYFKQTKADRAKDFDTKYYAELDFVRKQIKSKT